MKPLMMTLFVAVLAMTTAHARQTPECTRDYQRMIDNTGKQDVVSRKMVGRWDARVVLTEMEQKAFGEYIDFHEQFVTFDQETKFEVELTLLRDRKDPSRFVGFKISVDDHYNDEDQIDFFFGPGQKLLFGHLHNQSPADFWFCEGYVTREERLLKEYIRDMGEYFTPEDHPERFVLIKLEELPRNTRLLADDLLFERQSELRQWDEPGDAGFDAAYQVRDENGVVIGHIVTIWDWIDHPLWDGSGVTLWFDNSGKLVDQVDWQG